MNRRPLPVTLIALVFLGAGSVGLAYHAPELGSKPLLEYGLVCSLRLLAIVGGAFLLRGANWARWLLAAWMVYHVILSALHSTSQLVTHTVLFGLIACVLFHPASSRYFAGTRAGPPGTLPAPSSPARTES